MADVNSEIEHSGCYQDPSKDEGVDVTKIPPPKLSDLFSPKVIKEIKCESRLGKLYCDLYWCLDRRARKTIRHKTQTEAVTFEILRLLEDNNQTYLEQARELFVDPDGELFMLKLLRFAFDLILYGGLIFLVIGVINLEVDTNPYLYCWGLVWWMTVSSFVFYLTTQSKVSTRRAQDQLRTWIRVREAVTELSRLEPPCECSYCFQYMVGGHDYAIIKRESGRRKFLLKCN